MHRKILELIFLDWYNRLVLLVHSCNRPLVVKYVTFLLHILTKAWISVQCLLVEKRVPYIFAIGPINN
jgi:hypothetical protein